MMLNVVSKKSSRFVRAAGGALVAIGVIVSWAWSTDLTLEGRTAETSLAGVATFVLLGGGIAMLWRASPHRGRRARAIYPVALGACAAAGLIAGVVPAVVTVTTTGTVTTAISSTGSTSEYRLSQVANVTSDIYHRTNLDLTVYAEERTAPQLDATVSFDDGTPDLTCFNTRSVWIHDVATVTLMCADFTRISSLRAISAVTVIER